MYVKTAMISDKTLENVANIVVIFRVVPPKFPTKSPFRLIENAVILRLVYTKYEGIS